MGASGLLQQKIDADLVARLECRSGPIKRASPPRKREPRPASSYRAARRNAARDDLSALPRHRPELIESIAPAAHLNRSERWPRARTYAYAREISPCPERPVR